MAQIHYTVHNYTTQNGWWRPMVEQCPISWRHPSFNWRNPHFCRNPKKIEDVTCHNFSSICLFYLSRVAILFYMVTLW